MNSPIRYVGSKHKLASFILSIAPPHDAFVDVFGGSAAMLFRKPPEISKMEIYNDVNSHIVSFFRVLREQTEALQKLCTLTPYSREEYLSARVTYTDPALSDLERARRFLIATAQGYAGRHMGGWGFSRVVNVGQRFVNAVDEFMEIAQRLRKVTIENDDFERIVERYGQSPGNLLYADPPYMPETRNYAADSCYCDGDNVCVRCQLYLHDMPLKEQERFLRCIVKAPAMVMISGYDNDLYEDYLHRWKRYAKDVPVNCSRTVNEKRKRATETVWVNPAAEIAFLEKKIPLVPLL